MDIEDQQGEHIDYFVKKATNLKGSALSNVVVEATSHPSLFAFSEILTVPSVAEGDVEFRGHEEIFEHGGVMDFEEDRSRSKRRRHPIG